MIHRVETVNYSHHFMIFRSLGPFTIAFIWFRVVALVCSCVALFAAYIVGHEIVGRGMTGAMTDVFAPGFFRFDGDDLNITIDQPLYVAARERALF